MLLRSVRRPEDLAALDELFEIVDECDGHRPIGEHKYLDLLHGDPARDAGLVGEIAGTVVAYAAVSEPTADGTGAVEIAIHPLHRSQDVVASVLAGAVDRVRATGASKVRTWTFHPHFVGMLEAMGFHPERELRQLRRTLPADAEPRFPEGLSVRGFRVGYDEPTWLAVNNAAFGGHPENGRWTREVLEDRKAQAWFDPDGFKMVWDGDELAGFCWTKMHDRGEGEIYVIAVTAEKRRRGLGRRGATSAMLYVDADNVAGIRLYERLGFRLDHVDRSLVMQLDR
jgi:mycothiol synthase